ncbi:MAG: glycosyltransferase [Rhodobacteraceae bacterium]|jgi:GT2 family glycosyltransferase|nr:glycosyltransferase [Paracoccaceae bacterium]
MRPPETPKARPPVVMFAYRRPDHLRRTLAALAANDGASETHVILHSDGPRGAADAAAVKAVRKVAQEAVGSGAFGDFAIVAQDRNKGLAANIVDGVTAAMAAHGRAIVVEDDIVTARGFLDFMRAGLDRFEGDPRVWHISGWFYDIDPAGLPDYALWQVMNCWGWASWADRWQHYREDPQRIVRDWDRATRRRYNLDGAHDFFCQIEDNASGRKYTWDCFWYAAIFEAGGLCLTPTRAFARNIGLDGTGENCGPADMPALDTSRRFESFPPEIGESPEMVARVKAKVRLPMLNRAKRGVKLTLMSVAPQATERLLGAYGKLQRPS